MPFIWQEHTIDQQPLGHHWFFWSCKPGQVPWPTWKISKTHGNPETKLFGQVRINEALGQAAVISVQRHNEQVNKNRDILKKLVIAMDLGQQEQAFRGHDESATSLRYFFWTWQCICWVRYCHGGTPWDKHHIYRYVKHHTEWQIRASQTWYKVKLTVRSVQHPS